MGSIDLKGTGIESYKVRNELGTKKNGFEVRALWL